MESAFEPALRKEETPEALLVIVDLPGFRRKDLRVEDDEQGNLIISGERGVNEMEEITNEGGRLDTTQSGRRTFRKVISIPENVNVEDITAKFKNQVLQVSLPFVQKNQKLLTEDVNGGGKPHLADLSEQSKQDGVEFAFDPAVRTEETPEALIVIIDIPGFRGKDVTAQVDEQGYLIISGERSVNERREITKEGGTLDTTQSRGHTFRKVISIPKNVNSDDITAKLKDQVLRVSLPFVQKNQMLHANGGAKPHVADLSEQSKQDERSNPVEQQGLMQERPAATQKDEGARLPEVIRSDDHEAKANETAEESRAETPKHAQDFVHGEHPISTHAQAVSPVEVGSDGDQSQLIKSKSKQRKKHDERYLPSPKDEFPWREIHIPSSTSERSMFSNGFLLVASTLLVLCVAMYLSYILRAD